MTSHRGIYRDALIFFYHDNSKGVECKGDGGMTSRRDIYQDAVVSPIEPIWLVMEPGAHLFFDRRVVHHCQCSCVCTM